MKIATRLSVALALLPALLAPLPGAAQAAPDMAQGEIRKVDREAGKVTIKHGDIPSIGMPPMTMVFETRDATLLERFKAGDKVRFQAASVNGKFVVTDMKPAP